MFWVKDQLRIMTLKLFIYFQYCVANHNQLLTLIEVYKDAAVASSVLFRFCRSYLEFTCINSHYKPLFIISVYIYIHQVY